MPLDFVSHLLRVHKFVGLFWWTYLRVPGSVWHVLYSFFMHFWMYYRLNSSPPTWNSFFGLVLAIDFMFHCILKLFNNNLSKPRKIMMSWYKKPLLCCNSKNRCQHCSNSLIWESSSTLHCNRRKIWIDSLYKKNIRSFFKSIWDSKSSESYASCGFMPAKAMIFGMKWYSMFCFGTGTVRQAPQSSWPYIYTS